ncbi:MAG TPA: hypothetical protein VFA29_11675 [Candidatus Baltobacteraceae bacterium]|nr:hypothetical protein [Candidatus Baltobacteraceae bacterium]
MSTSAPPLPAVRAALSSLIDYAGLFPPAKLDLAPAVSEYAALRRGRLSWILGRFIIVESRLNELSQAIPQDESPFAVSLILDRGEGTRPLPAGGAVQIGAVEIPLSDADARSAVAAIEASGAGSLPAYAEWPRTGEAPDRMMRDLASEGIGAKIRMGGLTAAAFPQPGEAAQFVCAAARHRVPFKATAGLHHPIRHVDVSTGFYMHGFLNLLFAAVFAHGGAPEADVTQILADEDPSNFVFNSDGLRYRDRAASTAQIETVRRELFAGYGSCSIDEPTDDLRQLGLI